MSPYRRNVMLGLTVMFALAVLAWMILRFGGNIGRIWGPPTITVRFVTDRADGVADGSPVSFLGLEMGHVSRVWLDPESRQRVYFEAAINRDPQLPANVRAVIRTASLLGAGSAVALVMDGPPAATALKEGDEITARFVGFGELLPAEFGDLAGEMAAAAKQFRESNVVNELAAQVKNAGGMIDSVQKVIGDPKSQEDLKLAIANMRDVTERAKTLAEKLDRFADDLQKTGANANETLTDARAQVVKAGNNIDAISRQMGDRLTQIAKLLDQFQSIAEKVDKGQGSAGALVNDPRLYESLVDTSRELNATIKDFKRLVEQWEQEGVTLRLR